MESNVSWPLIAQTIAIYLYKITLGISSQRLTPFPSPPSMSRLRGRRGSLRELSFLREAPFIKAKKVHPAKGFARKFPELIDHANHL